jgi:hypothetical protein
LKRSFAGHELDGIGGAPQSSGWSSGVGSESVSFSGHLGLDGRGRSKQRSDRAAFQIASTEIDRFVTKRGRVHSCFRLANGPAGPRLAARDQRPPARACGSWPPNRLARKTANLTAGRQDPVARDDQRHQIPGHGLTGVTVPGSVRRSWRVNDAIGSEDAEIGIGAGRPRRRPRPLSPSPHHGPARQNFRRPNRARQVCKDSPLEGTGFEPLVPRRKDLP